MATLGLIALVCVVGFWIIVFGYAFATTQTGRSTIGDIAELVGIGFLIYWVYLLWKDRKQIPGKIRHWWRENGKKQVKGGLIAGGIIGGMFLAVILWAMWLANH